MSILSEEMKKEIIELLKELNNKDSIEIGNSKTGSIKVYVNFDEPEKAERKIKKAIQILKEKRAEVLQ